ncbi:hypothetical protein EVAR_33592_1 [Eumeta japonica]|uniref:Uncharacterized protein n=1 Tax=Eumeta variegata TaxID=151549 RepID=A0A4C1W907_EUMVA|nr:hypothetical protein EVAR_33592_1 [Eumeta japonica]
MRYVNAKTCYVRNIAALGPPTATAPDVLLNYITRAFVRPDVVVRACAPFADLSTFDIPLISPLHPVCLRANVNIAPVKEGMPH